MNLNVRNAGTFTNPFVFVQTAKIRAPVPPAGGMKAKNNYPSFHPLDPVQIWIWELLRPQVHVRLTAVFREPDDKCSRALLLLTIGNSGLWKHQTHKKKGKT